MKHFKTTLPNREHRWHVHDNGDVWYQDNPYSGWTPSNCAEADLIDHPLVVETDADGEPLKQTDPDPYKEMREKELVEGGVW